MINFLRQNWMRFFAWAILLWILREGFGADAYDCIGVVTILVIPELFGTVKGWDNDFIYIDDSVDIDPDTDDYGDITG